MKPAKVYTRLARPLANLGSYQSLWTAADHLLLVQSTGMSESYQRFRYADIQALMVSPSDFRRIVNVVCFAFAALFFVVGIAWMMSSGAWGWMIPAGICTAVGLWNHLLGPTCKVILVTRVRSVALPIRRRRKAAVILARLNPVIHEAQTEQYTAASAAVTEPPPL